VGRERDRETERVLEETRETYQRGRALGSAATLATLTARRLDGRERVVEQDAGKHAAPEAVDEQRGSGIAHGAKRREGGSERVRSGSAGKPRLFFYFLGQDDQVRCVISRNPDLFALWYGTAFAETPTELRSSVGFLRNRPKSLETVGLNIRRNPHMVIKPKAGKQESSKARKLESSKARNVETTKRRNVEKRNA